MKTLNVLAALFLGTVAVLAMQRPPAPPEDKWFQSAVLGAPRPVLVKFGAEWCGPCRHVDSLLSQSADDLSRQVKVVRIDIDARPNLADHYHISSIPRLMLFNQGRLVAQHGGFADSDQLQDWVEETLE